MAEQTALYRKRYVPAEIIHLKDDEILLQTEDILITKWKVLKPKANFDNGYSCYFLKEGYKVSKFLQKDTLLFYYCDIIDTEFQTETNSYIFTDLLVDVIVHEDGKTEILDMTELADALSEGIITPKVVEMALRQMDQLLQVIYAGKFSDLIQNFEGR
ncbi:DUF402 domain-containing protein [Chakrabartyella piscis]|uniref:DUF402 domain-containing protein n=1 Tax=Chakrabartyella piscis TaxID=2918914 RepID=UPI002958B505|nr:DUF402 domain-containing protein [Chakrabartyella piscis]